MQNNSKAIALIGNPNCGKTTLFNHLTGSNQKVGNWPGVTVEQHHGKYVDAVTQQLVDVIDLPGCYSLIATPDMGLDEKITCEYIISKQNTIYVNVVDATHLSRDLYLSLQLLELAVPIIVVLNCVDLAQVSGIAIDAAALSAQLGCPIIPMVAKTGQGVQQLQSVVSDYSYVPKPCPEMPNICNQAFKLLQEKCSTGVALHILEGNVLLSQMFAGTSIDVEAVRADLQKQIPEALDLHIAQFRRNRVQQILDKSVASHIIKKRALSSASQKIDDVVLHKIWGPIIFLMVMYVMFNCAINIGGLLQIGFARVAESIFVDCLQYVLSSIGLTAWLTKFLAEGIGRGISITLTFIPVLSAMFFCLAFLESSGYMTRAAFIADRMMSFLGLSGKAFVPMIVGFGCNVPAVMGARILANKRERILTIMMLPFMSCSARLAIYAIFVAAFFPIGGQNVIFSLYLIGIFVAIITGLVLRNTMSEPAASMGLMEMPEYRWPVFSALLRQVWHRLKGFLVKSGILIVALSVIINGVGNEILASVGKFLTPMFAPMGIQASNWPATVGLFTGLIAKEAVVGTLNAFYLTQESMLQAFGSAAAAYAYLLFTLLYFPCVSVVAVISKELNFKWALFSVIWATGLAYIIASLFYQIATLNSWLWITILAMALGGFLVSARWLVIKEQRRALRRKVLPVTISVVQ